MYIAIVKCAVLIFVNALYKTPSLLLSITQLLELVSTNPNLYRNRVADGSGGSQPVNAVTYA